MTISSRLTPEQLHSLVTRLRYLALTLAGAALASSILFLFILMNTTNWALAMLVASNLLIFFTALSNVYDVSRGELSNTWRMVVVAQVFFLFSSFFVSGIGAWYGLTAAVLTLSAMAQIPAFQVRAGRIPVWVPFSAIISGVSIYLLDIYWPLQRFVFLMPWLAYQVAIIALPLLIYVGLSFYNFGARPLRVKLIVTFALVSLVTGLPIVSYLNWSNRDTLIQRENEKLQGAARQVANELDQFVTTTLNNIELEASLNDFSLFLQLTPHERQIGWTTIVQRTMRDLSRRDSLNIVSYALLDASGLVVIDSSGQDTDLLFDQLPYFIETMNTGRGRMSHIYAELTPRNVYEYFVYFTASIHDEENTIIGVLRVKYRANIFQSIVQQYNNQAGLTSFAILTDENHIRLAHGRDSRQNFRLLAYSTQTILENLIADERLPSASQEDLATRLDDFDEKLRHSGTLPIFTTYVGEDLAAANGERTNTSLARAAVAKTQSQPWKVTFSQEEAITLQPLQDQARVVGPLVLGIGFLLAGLSYGVSALYANPVSRLTDAAAQIVQGNLDTSVHFSNYEDEFGQLALTFNDMTRQIRQNVTTLETRVAERTRDIELRAFQLQTAAETGNIVSTIRDLDKLLPEVAELLSDRFGFYHVGIFLLDEVGEFAVLKATNSLGGKRMLNRGHRLQVGAVGIVGYVTAMSEPRISLDVGDDAVFFNNPDLPNTRSEMALPLIVRGKVIGALDIQSDEENAFSESDVAVLRVVADQVAVAIENARLFVELESAAEATRRAYGEITARAWADYADRQSVRGYLVRAADIVLPVSDQPTAIMASVARVDAHTLAVPIKFRDLILGAIRLQKEETASPWTDNEIVSLQNLADQLGAALENARLYRETQLAASRDRMVREIGDRMRRAPDMDSLIQTAVREMARTLGVNEAFVQISSATFSPEMVGQPIENANPSGNGGGGDLGEHPSFVGDTHE